MIETSKFLNNGFVSEPADDPASALLLQASPAILTDNRVDDPDPFDPALFRIRQDFANTAAVKSELTAIVTNPPFQLAAQFAHKAIGEAPFVALLLRMNFLESTLRLPFFRVAPPSRVWVSSRRLPMMRRQGWQGPRAASNACHAWFIWDRAAAAGCRLGWFDWAENATS
jgi:hypothetical protein